MPDITPFLIRLFTGTRRRVPQPVQVAISAVDPEGGLLRRPSSDPQLNLVSGLFWNVSQYSHARQCHPGCFYTRPRRPGVIRPYKNLRRKLLQQMYESKNNSCRVLESRGYVVLLEPKMYIIQYVNCLENRIGLRRSVRLTI